MNRDRWMNRHIEAKKLSNGKTIVVGYKSVSKEMDCSKPVAQFSTNFGLNKVEGGTKLGGPYAEIQDKAIAFANKNLDKKFNYIYMYLPNGVSIGFIDTSELSDAHIYLYNCKNPPAPNSDPFNTKVDKE
jgi:hypothetical protein